MSNSSKVPTRSEVWKMFRKIDLTPYHQAKNKLTYIPWSRAWSTAMDLIGDHLEIKWHGMTTAEGVHLDRIEAPGGTASVCCSALVDGVKYAECTLAVMDYRNNAIENPSSVDLQNSRQRCQTKVLAMLGLGLYLWENNGEFEVTPKVTPRKTPTKKVKPRAPAKKTVEKEKDTDTLVQELKDKINELYKADWKADEEVQKQIKLAIQGNDIQKIKKLLKMLNDVNAVALTLHNGGANA